jgi:LysR family glycine cleavage system transcriptional activator
MSRAADELRVTHGAVSRHIAKLEAFLGARLFERKPHQLSLTPQGSAYAAQLTTLFNAIEEATSTNFDRSAASTALHVNALPTFATRWLVPRLADFNVRHPHIAVQVTTLMEDTPPDFDGSNVDIAICRGDGNWPNMRAFRLFDEILTPACSPNLTGPLENPDDLRHFVLLHSQQRGDDWRLWLDSAGATRVNPHSGLRLGNSHLAYQGAIHGLGIAMAQLAFIYDDLKQHRLRLLFDLRVRANCYYAVCLARRASVPKLAAFLSWLQEEAEHFHFEQPSVDSERPPPRQESRPEAQGHKTRKTRRQSKTSARRSTSR